eukprot:CAMPEP_0113907572 /NCGR_PEP_ID=MMETSP0780_2-20120614/25564_1 /TAXON_ID=652834 /ORGANISM="Palpitomonas bilix" /LENGTH=338 /DNA_ID=CAMNT_0000902671 /DNA_START=261 /DNA_END=1274 /DNA_ORIENTATION=+ /assembly_acc=CAM_ASM_000599
MSQQDRSALIGNWFQDQIWAKETRIVREEREDFMPRHDTRRMLPEDPAHVQTAVEKHEAMQRQAIKYVQKAEKPKMITAMNLHQSDRLRFVGRERGAGNGDLIPRHPDSHEQRAFETTSRDAQQQAWLTLGRPTMRMSKLATSVLQQPGGLMNFVAMKLDAPSMQEGRYRIVFYLEDSTAAVFHLPSGEEKVLTSKFFARQRIPYTHEDGSQGYYDAQDLFVGREIFVKGSPFVIVDADERTLSFMEENSGSFPLSDAQRVFDALREKVSGKEEEVQTLCRTAKSKLDSEAFYELCQHIARAIDCPLRAQEMVTMRRYLEEGSSLTVDPSSFLDEIFP